MNDWNDKQIFSRYSPFIRNYIYQSGWNELRQIQLEAAKVIFSTEDHLLISSDTASGKTEAAFFPILSIMKEESPELCQVLYISPLKSLINDQYMRMEHLLNETHIPVFRWHGDAGQSKKNDFLKNPRGLLQITPESLESMLCRRHNDIPRLFANLKFIVIDEIHALMGSDRGNQILCQIQRISRLISYEPRRIALSATIGDFEIARNWLKSGSERQVKLVHFREENASWKLGLNHFYLTDPAPEKGADPASLFIYRATEREKCVVFSNSREETEQICATLRQIAASKEEEDRFYIHHGNLSASIREETEAVLKNDEKAITACATATLELGIDIGQLKRIINQEAPTSVAGFLQRLGRSGRRGSPPEMLMVFRSEEALPNAPIHQLIPWNLLQAIAIIELYRTEKWIEPPEQKQLPASLLFHQTLSCLAGKGSASASRLCKDVLSLSPLSHFTKQDFKELLIHMLKNKVLQLTEEQDLVFGDKGEQILSGFKFFAVFKDSEDFTVRCGSEEIGTISAAPPIGEHFALAGRVWEVEEIDVSRRLLYCKHVEGKMKISWPGDQGFIHTRILERMKEILLTNEIPPYLMAGAVSRLENARQIAMRAKLKNTPILSQGGNSYVFFPWLGTKAFSALKRTLKRFSHELGIYDIQSGSCYYITLKWDGNNPMDLIKNLNVLIHRSDFTTTELIPNSEFPVFDKYDPYLPRNLLVRSFAENRLNLTELQDRLDQISNA